MTLYKEIAISIILLFVLSFLGTVTISTNNLRSFLVTQLESHAQDTATSLGLSISPHMGEGDLPIVEAMVDAIFDRGDFRKISVTATSGEALVERNNPDIDRQAPGWFTRLFSIEPPDVEALVMSGWIEAGTVAVSSNPAHAYREIWNNTLDNLKLFLASAVVTLILGLLAVRLLLRPLREVEIQADAICNQSYPIQEKLPRTRELKRVVMAMNRLAQKISSLFNDQSALTERMREQAFQDPVTGLGNRRYFDRQLQAQLDIREDPVAGAFLLIELRELADINEKHGYPGGDRLLQRTGEILQTRLDGIDNCFPARIAGASFGIVLVGMESSDAELLAESLCHSLQQLHADELVESDDICNIGIAMWKHGDSVEDLLTEANTALRAAQSNGNNNWQRHEPPAAEQAEIQGTLQWRKYLKEIIDTGNVSLLSQPVHAFNKEEDTLLHREVLLRIPDRSGENITAGVFMPMAEHAGMASEMDKLSVTTLLKYLASVDDGVDYAVNLSATSLSDAAFMDWLCNRLAESPEQVKRLLVEFPEYGILKDIENARIIIDRLRDIGCRCGIDHFGRGFYSFGYLHSMKINYLKVDRSYTRNIETEEDNQFFIQALTDTAHSIDINVFAQAIETVKERVTMQRLNLDGMQGYLGGVPSPL